MPRRKAPEDLSVEELRRLLIDKRRGRRSERLDHFRRTGRVVDVAPPLESEQELELPGERRDVPTRKRRRLLDRILLGVEILAIAGLLGVLLSGLGMLRDLNREVAAALRPATAEPTPLVMAVVLPSGHTPPDAQGNTRPNEAEIPEHLRPLVQSLANLPAPTPSIQQAVRIEIPALKVDAPVVQGDGWEQLKKGVAQHIGQSGQTGNVVLSA
jgi:sortase A